MFSQFSERVNSKLDQLNQSISLVASSCPSSVAVCGDKLKGIGQKVRRLSSPARKLSSPVAQAGCSGARRFSQFVSGISEFIDEELDLGQKPTPRLFGSSYLNREWEIVTVREMCRRLSLDQLDKVVLPLPDGAASSQILDEPMIRQIVDVLPARAAGYPWINIYNSEKHGFSLHTFYRKMIDWDEEMSPILLIIRDCGENVFGAIVSTTLRPCEHFFGTGDSCLLYRYVNDPDTDEKELRTYSWSGQNQLFVKASRDSLAVGAGGGHYGLWLDADLNHGRSQTCETFQNEPLSGENEDFTVHTPGFFMSSSCDPLTTDIVNEYLAAHHLYDKFVY